MERRRFLAGTAAATAGTATTAVADDERRRGAQIEGSWFATVTATNPPLGQFTDLISFHPGGIVTESRRYLFPDTPFGDLLETTAHGAWKRTGRNTYEAFFRFLLQQAGSGTHLGTDNIRLRLTLERTGRLAGTFVSEIKDPADAVIFTASGTYTASRIEV